MSAVLRSKPATAASRRAAPTFSKRASTSSASAAGASARRAAEDLAGEVERAHHPGERGALLLPAHEGVDAPGANDLRAVFAQRREVDVDEPLADTSQGVRAQRAVERHLQRNRPGDLCDEGAMLIDEGLAGCSPVSINHPCMYSAPCAGEEPDGNVSVLAGRGRGRQAAGCGGSALKEPWQVKLCSAVHVP